VSGRAQTPVVPADYYRAIFDVDRSHWWHRGMLEITRALLGARLERPELRLLDVGCGTGGFISWVREVASQAALTGVDVSEEALRLARTRLPGVDLRLASASSLPFEDGAFDLVVLNDVLQHLREDDVEASLLELRRMLAAGGALLVRTNGARRVWRASAEWRLYDARTLAAGLDRVGLLCERLTHANVAGSLWAAARGTRPSPPSETSHGVPSAGSSAGDGAKLRLLLLEARYLSRPGRSLPYGHTIFALATPARR
jgi:SAM-dependent methyltransferase